MRLDPKYFNRFIAVCAFFTVLVIVYGTLRYQKNQETTFRSNLAATDLTTLWFPMVSGSDSLQLSQFFGQPVLVDFWATWSDKASRMHRVIDSLKTEYPELRVIASAVRDNEEYVTAYIDEHGYDFTYVQGTRIYSDLQIPGIPSQFFIDRNGDVADVQVGEDGEALINKIRSILDK